MAPFFTGTIWPLGIQNASGLTMFHKLRKRTLLMARGRCLKTRKSTQMPLSSAMSDSTGQLYIASTKIKDGVRN